MSDAGRRLIKAATEAAEMSDILNRLERWIKIYGEPHNRNLPDCEDQALMWDARQEIKRLTKERDEAFERVEELETEGERVAAEFEGDLWKEVRSLLDDCNFSWRDVDSDGVTAAQAVDHIRETLREEIRRAERAEAALATARTDALREALEPIRGLMEPIEQKAFDVGYNAACVDAEDAILALIDQPSSGGANG